MPYKETLRPIPGRKAFEQTGDVAILSQAAVLLLLGSQLRGDRGVVAARAAAVGRAKHVVDLPSEDMAQLGPPIVSFAGERYAVQSVHASLAKRYGRAALRGIQRMPKPKVSAELLGDLAKRLYKKPNAPVCAELMEACLGHDAEIVRVAAAAAYFRLSAEPHRPLRVLEQGAKSKDELVRDVAATALARVAPAHPHLDLLLRAKPSRRVRRRSDTTLLIHGTWARNNDWWQPGGDFHSYILNNVRPDLYSQPDRFEWSGGYSDGARALAAQDLIRWVDDRGEQGLDLITHSHGGSVAMLASASTLNIGELVLLSCPVHAAQYFPNFNQVRKVVSIRVRLDLVILADGGGQRFRHPQIEENVLPIWFNHSATHDPDVWRRYNVPAML